MGYETFGVVKQWISAPAGECDDLKLTELGNDVRRLLYLMYESVPLFLDYVMCYEVQRFLANCNDCHSHYLGLTLPRDCQTVEAMWLNDRPVELFDSWREFQYGLSPQCSSGIKKFDMPGHFPTERDMEHPGTKIKVLTTHGGDEGVQVTIEGVDLFGKPFRENLVLLADGYTPTEANVVTLRPGGVRKPRTKGRIIIAEESGRILSRLEPDETVPAYKRIKFTGIGDDCRHVNIRAARRFYPLYDDGDVVETDNKLALQEAARYLTLNRGQVKSKEELASMQLSYATCQKHLLGDKARETGKSTQGTLRIVSPSMGVGHQLRSRTRWR